MPSSTRGYLVLLPDGTQAWFANLRDLCAEVQAQAMKVADEIMGISGPNRAVEELTYYMGRIKYIPLDDIEGSSLIPLTFPETLSTCASWQVGMESGNATLSIGPVRRRRKSQRSSGSVSKSWKPKPPQGSED